MNRIKQALRNILALKQNALFNLIGLTLGFSSFTLVSIWAYANVSFDKFHSNYEQIYFVNCIDTSFNDEDLVMPLPMAEFLREKFPELKQTATYHFWPDIYPIKSEDKKFFEKITPADSQIFSILDFNFIQKVGNLFSEPSHLALSESVAIKIFGSPHCVGQKLMISDSINCTVAAVYHDFPENSTLTPAILSSYKTSSLFMNCTGWNNYCYHTITKIPAHTDIYNLGNKMTKALFEAHEMEEIYSLFPLSKIHLEQPGEKSKTGHLLMIFLSGALVLMVSCINFINLLTAGFLKQNKQSSVKLMLGASKFRLIKGSILESSLYVITALCISILVSFIAEPYLSNQMNLNFLKVFGAAKFLAIHVAVAIVVLLLVSVYPALIYVYRHTCYNSIVNASIKLRQKSADKGFVVFQFAVAIIIGIVAFVMQKQLSHAMHTEKGYDAKDVIIAECWNYPIHNNKAAIKDFLSTNPNVVSYSISERGFNGLGSRTTGFGHPAWTEKQNDKYKVMFRTDENLFKTMGLQLVAGRNFDPEKFNEATNIIVNETYANQLGGVDSCLRLNLKNGDSNYQIIGICNDFLFESFYQSIEPMVILYNTNWTSSVLIKTQANKNSLVMKDFSSFLQTKADDPFEISRHESLISDMYSTEKSQRQLLSIFGVLTIIISCLGLLGLTIFSTENRIKEIGIRKVNGATITEIVSMLNGDFLKWVIVACVIACPVALYLMHKWLQNFAYKTSLSWWIFALAAVSAILIAFLTVSWQTYKAAKRNPVEALRYE